MGSTFTVLVDAEINEIPYTKNTRSIFSLLKRFEDEWDIVNIIESIHEIRFMVEQLQQPSVEQLAEQDMLNGRMPNLQELKELPQFDDKIDFGTKFKPSINKEYDKTKTKVRSKEFNLEKQSEFIKEQSFKKGISTKVAPGPRIWNEESFQIFREDSD